MSDQSQGPGWWVASDGKWYPPQPPSGQPPAPTAAGNATGGPPMGAPPGSQPAPSGGSSTALLIGIGALVVVVLLGGLVFALTRPKADVATPPQVATTVLGSGGATSTSPSKSTTTEKSGDPSTTAKTKTTKGSSDGPADFPPPKNPAGAIKAAGLPELSEEGSVVHYHAHLDVIINGEPVTVASQIGIARTTISPLHTHDKSGVVHIEAEEDEAFTTQQFFTQWEVELSAECVGEFCVDDDHQLLAFVNGEQVDDPSAIVFAKHDEVVIWYGSADDPADIPTTYDFPDGL